MTTSLTPRRLRADAQRNTAAVLDAATAVFAEAGVDAPVREIAVRAGVGVGTIYRHFPRRSDLIAAVFRREVDACADAAIALAGQHPPGAALAAWLQRYTRFIATKRGLAGALHSGDAAFDALPAYFEAHLGPALRSLLETAATAGEIRGDIAPHDLLQAVANLCFPGDTAHAERMVALLVDGLRFGAPTAARALAERVEAGVTSSGGSASESEAP